MKQEVDITKRNFHCLSGNVLKILACCFMLCDHVGYILLDDNGIMRAIGRLSFPIFAFLLVEGFRHTSDIKKYLLRLFVFALLSEIPFDLCVTGKILEFGHQNIFFTLTVSLLLITYLEHRHKFDNQVVDSSIAIVISIGVTVLAFLLLFDYGGAGVLLTIIFYYTEPFCQLKSSKDKWIQAGKMTFLSGVLYGLVFELSQMFALLAIFPISMYNGKRGNIKLKYAFYLFYPIHLLIIWGIHKLVLT